MKNYTSEELLQAALKSADEKKAKDPLVLDIRKVAGFADYFLLLSGGSMRQVAAIVDGIEEDMVKGGFDVLHTEGRGESGWVLLDLGDVIVHVFGDAEREFYKLEDLWADAVRIRPEA